MGSRAKYDEAKKADIASGWEASGLSQEEWARRWGISSRTLRHYLRRYQPARHWDGELQVVVGRAVEALNAIAKVMGRAETAEPRPVDKAHPAPPLAAPIQKKRFSWD